MQRSAKGPSRSNDNFSLFQELESRRLMSAAVQLPFALDFSGVVGGTAVDRDGQGTGFAAAQTGQASQIDINTARGTLALTADYSSSRPSASLETAFDGTTRGFTISSRLLGPLGNLLHTGDRAGIFLGPDQNNCVKVTAVYSSTGEKLQFTAVVNGQSVTAEAGTYTNLGVKFSAISTLDVQLTGDAVTGQVTARYAINGKSFTKVGYTLTVPAASKSLLFNSVSRAGLLMSDKHGSVTATFDSFAINAGTVAYVPVAVISRQQVALSDLTGSGSSAAQTVRVTNNGDGDLVISSADLSGDNASEFKLTNPLTNTITLKTGERHDFYVTFTATNSNVVRNATLTFATNDASGVPTSVALRGLGLAGAGGVNEPALQRIIDIYGFKTATGQSTTSNAFDSSIQSADEVTMPRLTKAGGGPVAIDLLGVFANQNSRTTLGWYEAGNPQTTFLAGGIDPTKAQSLSPLDDGRLTFDPAANGSSGNFGLYGNFTLGSTTKPLNRNVYSEDVLNAWETDSAKQKKVRFYKLRDSSGNVVPNAYIFAFEEYNVTFDQNDIVGVIRNVQPAASGAELGLENLDGVPAADQLVMSRVTHKNTSLPNQFHDISTLRVRNTGDQPLNIASTVLSNADFVVLSGGGAQTLAPGAYTDVRVQFVYDESTGLGNKLRKATLTITSDDSDEPTKTVKLNGLWQSYSENQPNGVSAEPTAETVVEAFGYNTTISTKTSPINTKGWATASGDEVMSELWQRADTGLPVTVRMLATYHQQYDVQWNTRSSVSWYDPAKINTAKNKPTLNLVVAHDQVDSQSLLPRLEGSATAPAVGSFIPGAAAFGFNVDSYNGTYSQDALNTPNDAANPGHGWRFYVAKDASGNIIPDTYIACQDYVKVSWANYDYQDNILLITNVKPDSAPQTVQGVKAVGLTDGTSVSWAAATAKNVTSYNVYRRVGGTSDSFITVGNVSGTTFVDSTAVNGTTYDYSVTGVAYQGGESAQSGIVTATAGTGTVSVPAAAGSVVATANSSASVTVKWADNSGSETGFRVERKTAGGTYAPVGTVGANVLTFTDGTASGSTTYTYRVFAVNAAGDSAASNESVVSTPAVTPTTTQQTLAPVADAYVYDSTPTTNYGTSGTMQIKKGSAGYNRQGLIQFDVRALANVTTAKLRLFANLNTADSVQVAVYGVASQTWTEAAVTYATRPASGSLLGTAGVNSTSGAWIEIDVSAYVKQAVANGQTTVSLSLQGTASSTAYVSVATRETGANGPQLVVA